jgi:tRNA pseudouridine38-40 synthase
MRYFFEIAYKGTNYSGWQTQHNAVTVQEVVEDGLTKLTGEKIEIIGSGRTDTGVHCEQQFFHADIKKEIILKDFQHRLNVLLPKDISIQSIRKVKPEASARFDAIARTYHYRITLRKDPLLDGLALHYFKSADVSTMNKAAALLLGEHDFQCFSKVKTNVNHFLCDITKAEWRQKDDQLEFVITANRFLRGMVRAVVGTLLDVGTGKMAIKDFQAIINSKDRKKAGQNVSPEGLYLMKVKYPSSIFLK